MIKFVFLAVCALSLTQATPSKLSREFGTAPQIERQQAFNVALEELKNFDYVGVFLKLVLKSPEKAVANVNELLIKNNNAGAEEVLDAFNAGLNARIFVINGDYIEIDRTAFERMLFENTLGFAPSLQQRSVNSMYQRKLQEYVSAIEFKQPLEQFTAVLKAEKRQVGLRIQSLSFIIDSISLSISNAISTIVSQVASLIVNSLTSIENLINNVLTWLQTNISFLYSLLNPIGTLIINIIQQIVNSVSSLITPATGAARKRREVSNDTVVDAPTNNNGLIGTLLNYLVQALTSVLGGVGNNILSVFTNIANLVQSAIASVQSILGLGNVTNPV